MILNKKIAIVYNPMGGSASEGKRNELAGFFQSRGVEVMFCATTAEAGSATKLARSAVEAGVELVVAFGGDGTACQVADALRGTNVPMAVYPGGTGNLFARSFYSDPTPAQFAQMILNGQPQPIDMVTACYTDLEGKEHCQPWMVGFGLGKVSDAISTASPFFKKIFGRLVYVVKVTLACLWPNARRYQIDGPDHIDGHAAAVFALNVTPPVMSTMSRGCNASDGLIDVVIFKAQNAWQLITVALWLAIGRPDRSKHYVRVRTDQLNIKCSKTMLPNIDGDPGAPTKEITLKVHKGAVQMVLS